MFLLSRSFLRPISTGPDHLAPRSLWFPANRSRPMTTCTYSSPCLSPSTAAGGHVGTGLWENDARSTCSLRLAAGQRLRLPGIGVLTAQYRQTYKRDTVMRSINSSPGPWADPL